MKKKLILLTFLFALIIVPFASAELIINQQPDEIYNIGDTINIPVSIMTSSDISDEFYMNLICSGKVIQFCQNGVSLLAGEGKVMDCSLVLTKAKLGDTTGNCKISGYLLKQKADPIVTDIFKISNSLVIQPNTQQKEFEPKQNVLIFGNAIKENGHDVNGFINLEIIADNSSQSIIQSGIISNGMYSLNITFPENMKAGNYLVKLTAYELNEDGLKTNTGFINYNIAIKQIPTYLELVFATSEVEPGTDVKVKAVLHDQTGEKINSNAIITIKRGTTDIQVQSETATDEYLEFPILYNEPSANWTVFALSNQLTAESKFIIIEKADIKVDIINKTVLFVNTGNIPYNDTVVIKIGEQSIGVPVFLQVDETQKYELKAPNGEYEVQITDNNGESKAASRVLLTGNAIGIKNLSKSGLNGSFGEILSLTFIVLVFLSIIFIFGRRIYKKKVYLWGLFKKKSKKQPKVNVAWENRAMPLSKDSKLETKNKANLSSSIKGNKQEISLVNIKIKNLREVQAQKGNVEEPLQKIINTAENKKAFVYENQENLFFLVIPSKTKTLQNEPIAFEIAQTAKEILSDYNRIAKHKLDFGISIEYGPIIERTEKGIMEFMSLENLMTNAKRIAAVSQGEVLLGEKIKDKLTSVRTEKQDNGRFVFYKIKEIKYHDEEHSRFIKSFLKKAEEKKGQF